ncbi:hypothetical protein KY289_016131 [Solanum tuberosum]|nr:hypothetical protein KY289_016131 [Solanum tuberosum]
MNGGHWSESLHGIDTNGSGINFNGPIKVEAKAMYNTRFIPIWMLNCMSN